MPNYYVEQLNAKKLSAVYNTNIPRIRQYLEAEIGCVAKRLAKKDDVIELGAGYGRVIRELAPYVKHIDDVDISFSSVEFGRNFLADISNARLFHADVFEFKTEQKYDAVLCLQNGLSAIRGGGAGGLVNKAVKLLKPGGKAFFSSYSPKFWAYRLAWFQEQADKGLLGTLDLIRSIHGRIVCKDGFISDTCTAKKLKELGRASRLPFYIEEVDDSSIFLVIQKQL